MQVSLQPKILMESAGPTPEIRQGLGKNDESFPDRIDF